MADTHQGLKCPACNKEMTKVFVPREGVNIDICLDGCGGMWFDNRELSYFDEQNEKIDEILAAITNRTFAEVDQMNKRSCPACGARMVKNFSSVKQAIQIDECYSCGGKFLDKSELLKFRDEYATSEDRSQDTLKLMYDTVGKDLIKLQEENEELKKHRSSLKKWFDHIIYD